MYNFGVVLPTDFVIPASEFLTASNKDIFLKQAKCQIYPMISHRSRENVKNCVPKLSEINFVPRLRLSRIAE